MSTDVEALRLQLLANGYSPIRNRDKRTFMTGWPSVELTEEEIRSWSRRHKRDTATGLRVEKGLAVIDIDIDDRQMVDRIADRVLDIVPQLERADVPLLVRRGKGAKEAWFVRTEEMFSRIHSRSWVRPGESVDAGAHAVEVFGGASARQFGAFGPHTVADDGTVEVRYRWNDKSPADTLQSELPALTKQQFFAIVDAAEAELRAAGWEPVARSQKGESDAVRVYDLTDAMQFDTLAGDRLSLQQLRELAAGDDAVRCSASWHGDGAVNRTRCLVSLSRAGNLTIWDSASGVTHCEASAKPRDYSADIDRIAEKLKELDERRRNKISSADGAPVAATKLLATYAFCPFETKGVVPLYATTMDEGMTLPSFRTMMLPNCDSETGPRGGIVTTNPVDIWASSDRRLTVAGTRMRPDKERPTYEEGGARWVNCYSPPLHRTPEGVSGDLATGLEFMEQIVPDPEEREWFMRWLAFKFRWPHVPGPAIVLVAHGKYGTGRGTFADLLKRLFGSSYVKEMSYDMVAGRTYQSQYTDWAAGQLIVFVAESAEVDAGASSYKTKISTYEHLKSMIEPNPVERTFISKGSRSFTALACASFIIATNHADALPIPENDRRFAVLTSGDKRDPVYWERVRSWLADEANIAAFAEHLRTLDLGAYSPFAEPMRTYAKRAMVDNAKTDLDRAIELVLENLSSDVATIDQVVTFLRQAQTRFSFDYPDRWQPVAKRLIPKVMYRVGVPDSTNWQVKQETRKYAVYARTDKAARHWRTRDHLREEALKNGPLDGSSAGGTVVKGLFDRIRSPVA